MSKVCSSGCGAGGVSSGAGGAVGGLSSPLGGFSGFSLIDHGRDLNSKDKGEVKLYDVKPKRSDYENLNRYNQPIGGTVSMHADYPGHFQMGFSNPNFSGYTGGRVPGYHNTTPMLAAGPVGYSGGSSYSSEPGMKGAGAGVDYSSQ